jgi:acyl-CoA synthetase (NDP forming)
MREMPLEEVVKPVYDASRDVIQAIYRLIEYTEQLEEELLKKRADKVELSKEELAEIDSTLHRMHEKGESMSLDEFNRKHISEIQSDRLP